jgi:hypothetical protein
MKNYIASDGSKWVIRNISPSIPTRALDWEWHSEEYDGPGDNRMGHCASNASCIDQIETWILENV